MDFTEQLIRNAMRRESAEKKVSVCSVCGSEQVQLVSWLSSTITFKCRHCKHKWSIHDEWQ